MSPPFPPLPLSAVEVDCAAELVDVLVVTVMEVIELAGTTVVLVELMVTVATVLLPLETEGTTELEDEEVEIWLLIELDEIALAEEEEVTTTLLLLLLLPELDGNTLVEVEVMMLLFELDRTMLLELDGTTPLEVGAIAMLLLLAAVEELDDGTIDDVVDELDEVE